MPVVAGHRLDLAVTPGRVGEVLDGSTLDPGVSSHVKERSRSVHVGRGCEGSGVIRAHTLGAGRLQDVVTNPEGRELLLQPFDVAGADHGGVHRGPDLQVGAGGEPAHPVAWYLMAAGTVAWVAGDGLYGWYEHVALIAPFPSPATLSSVPSHIRSMPSANETTCPSAPTARSAVHDVSNRDEAGGERMPLNDDGPEEVGRDRRRSKDRRRRDQDRLRNPRRTVEVNSTPPA